MEFLYSVFRLGYNAPPFIEMQVSKPEKLDSVFPENKATVPVPIMGRERKAGPLMHRVGERMNEQPMLTMKPLPSRLFPAPLPALVFRVTCCLQTQRLSGAPWHKATHFSLAAPLQNAGF